MLFLLQYKSMCASIIQEKLFFHKCSIIFGPNKRQVDKTFSNKYLFIGHKNLFFFFIIKFPQFCVIHAYSYLYLDYFVLNFNHDPI